MLRNRKSIRKSFGSEGLWNKSVSLVLLLVIIFLGLFKLNSIPALWWDEGWTLSVARNWTEQNHYGHLLEGKPHSAGLSAAFPVVMPVALSFKLFGVGIWQGRLPGVIFTLLSMGLLYYLAKRLFDRGSASGMLVVLLLMSVSPWLHPILLGRQVLGEMPAIFYLLAGYTFFLLTLTRSALFLIPSILFWGIAIKTKAQIPPFFWVSLLVPLVCSIIQRWWRQVALLGLGLVGTWLVGQEFLRWQSLILEGHIIQGSHLEDLYSLTAIVPDWGVRLVALQSALAYAAPAIIGLVLYGWQITKNFNRKEANSNLEVIKLCLLAFSGSWMAWYILMGMWWPRYLFSAAFIGSVFAGAALSRATSQFNWRKTLQNASEIIYKRQIDRTSLGAFGALVLTFYTVPITAAMLILYYFSYGSQPVFQVTDFLNKNLVPDSLVETYDSELLFLSHKKIHYPPDQMSVLLESRVELEEDIEIDYDPLAEDPDYLVVGPFSKRWALYESVLNTKAFMLIYEVPGYQIYKRNRP